MSQFRNFAYAPSCARVAPRHAPRPLHPRAPCAPARMLVAARAAEDGGESDSLLASRIATLESWQLRRLKQAHFLGKHQRSIKQLAGDLNMDREDVIDFLRQYARLPASQLESEREALAAEEAARAERREAVARGAEGAREGGAGGGGAPARATFAELKEAGLVGRRRVTGMVERTLESVYEKTPWPSDEVLSGVYDVHKVPRRDLIEWFKERRQRDGVRGGGGRGGGGWVDGGRGGGRGRGGRGGISSARGRGRGRSGRGSGREGMGRREEGGRWWGPEGWMDDKTWLEGRG